MTGDVVAELDRYLNDTYTLDITIQRARDEIVALREKNVEVLRLVAGEIKQRARDDALEEAARVCEGGYTTGSTASTLKAVAAAIRKLKDKA